MAEKSKADSNGGIKLIALLGAMGLIATLQQFAQAPSNLRITGNEDDITTINLKMEGDNEREGKDQGRFATLEKGQEGMKENIVGNERLFLEKIRAIDVRILNLENSYKDQMTVNTELMKDNYESQLRELTRELRLRDNIEDVHSNP